VPVNDRLPIVSTAGDTFLGADQHFASLAVGGFGSTPDRRRPSSPPEIDDLITTLLDGKGIRPHNLL